ncbi:MAG: M14 family zinc carboxypeptidase, partial [Polyangia bacterium]
KNNARDVDLNRNFPSSNWTREHKPGYDPGAAPLSEPETQALARLIEELHPKVIVAVHQPFKCVNWDGPAQALANEMSAACGYPAVASVGYPTPGSFGSRYGVDLGLPVITLELPRPATDDDYAACLRALECARLTAAG